MKQEVAGQTSDCRKRLDLPPRAEAGIRPACKRCAPVEYLLQLVAEMQEAVRRLCNIRKAENELHS